MMYTFNSLALTAFVFLLSCGKKTNNNPLPDNPDILIEAASNIAEEPVLIPFSRDTIVAQLKNKIASGKPLIVHIFVPLCDNDHQNIVPVNKTLGDGKNPKTNLYWGAAYGVKTYFKNNGWKTETDITPLNDTILERIIFSRILEGGTKIIAIADVYDGSAMEICLTDLFEGMSGNTYDKNILPDETIIDLRTETDLFAFTGHDGLMDVNPTFLMNKKATPKDAIILACISADFFNQRLNCVNAYPLITTKSFMAPEAYALHAAILSWAAMEPPSTILEKTCSAYSQYQKCSLAGAHTVFKTGW